MRDYTQLTQEERYQIEALLKVGHPQSEIATVLKRHKSTISHEVRRNHGLRGYRPKQAQRLALVCREARAKPTYDNLGGAVAAGDLPPEESASRGSCEVTHWQGEALGEGTVSPQPPQPA